MSMAGDIFTDMVMQEAIKDKQAMVEREMADAARAQEQVEDDVQQDKDEDSDFDDDLDDLMNDEESEKILRSMKEQRMDAMKMDYEEQQKNKAMGHGTYIEIVEQEFLPVVTKSRYTVVAFFHKDFERCKIVDMHLHKIAPEHPECRFVRMDAERAPFFVQKLQIRMLPTIMCFVEGVAYDSVVGFEELGGKDDFPTLALTRRLVKAGVLKPKNGKESGKFKISRQNRDDSGSDCDD